MLTGVERLEVVQLSHWKVAEITGEAKRKISVALLREREGGRERERETERERAQLWNCGWKCIRSMHNNECMCLACMHAVYMIRENDTI